MKKIISSTLSGLSLVVFAMAMIMPILTWIGIIPPAYDFYDASFGLFHNEATRGMITSFLWNLFGGLTWGILALAVSFAFLVFSEWVMPESPSLWTRIKTSKKLLT